MFVFKSENRKWRIRAQPLICRKINRKRFFVSFSTSWRPVFQSSSSSFLSSFVSPDESASTFATSCTKSRFANNSHYLPEIHPLINTLFSPQFRRERPSLSRQITSPGPVTMATVSWARRSPPTSWGTTTRRRRRHPGPRTRGGCWWRPGSCSPGALTSTSGDIGWWWPVVVSPRRPDWSRAMSGARRGPGGRTRRQITPGAFSPRREAERERWGETGSHSRRSASTRGQSVYCWKIFEERSRRIIFA